MNSLLVEMLITHNQSQDGQGYIPTYISIYGEKRPLTVKSDGVQSSNCSRGWTGRLESCLNVVVI